MFFSRKKLLRMTAAKRSFDLHSCLSVVFRHSTVEVDSDSFLQTASVGPKCCNLSLPANRSCIYHKDPSKSLYVSQRQCMHQALEGM